MGSRPAQNPEELNENSQDTLGAKNPSLCDLGERETPFLVALRKFSSLALSQTKIPVARSSTNVREDSVKGKNSSTTVDEVLTEAPRAFNSLITRATQTEEEKQSAAVQTGSKANMTEVQFELARMTPTDGEINGCNQNSNLAASKTVNVKTHQRRTSIHSHQHAFQLPPHNQIHVGMLHQARPTTGIGGDCQDANVNVRKLQDLQSPHLSMQVLPQQENIWPGLSLAVLPKYKRDVRRPNLRSSKSTPHLDLQSKKPSIYLQPHQDPRRISHMQLISGLPQTYSTLV